jgi:hypothetical protein
MTLMPVTRIALSVDWSTNSGASAWIGGQLGIDRAALVDRLADDVEDAAERLRADGNADLRAGVGDGLAAGQALGRVHRDRADGVLAEMLGDFEDQAVAVIVGLERRKDRRQHAAIERNVDDGADHLADAADIVGRCRDGAGRARGGLRCARLARGLLCGRGCGGHLTFLGSDWRGR